MPTRMIRILTVLFLVLIARAAYADDCKAGARALTAPDERFILNDNGTVLDKNTGLTWMRCALGQTWDGTNCAGDAARYIWPDADWAKDNVNLDHYGGHADWRVPVVPELASLVELNCAGRRINTTVFPATPAAAFWSSMEKPGSAGHAYALDYGAGGAAPALKSNHGALRLVRGGPWWTPPNKSAQRE